VWVSGAPSWRAWAQSKLKTPGSTTRRRSERTRVIATIGTRKISLGRERMASTEGSRESRSRVLHPSFANRGVPTTATQIKERVETEESSAVCHKRRSSGSQLRKSIAPPHVLHTTPQFLTLAQPFDVRTDKTHCATTVIHNDWVKKDDRVIYS